MNLKIGLLFFLLALVAVMPIAAQEGATTDEVNQIADKMYCPVCENIPLDDCNTAACQDWREEIRLMLNDGMTEDQIVNDFIDRFGDRVVGTPRDPLLRALSLWTPAILSVLALIAAVWTIVRRTNAERDEVPAPATSANSDDLRAQLERDLNG